MRGSPSTLRGSALLAAGALTLHEARYLIAPQAGAEAGHGYLPFAGAAAALVLALAFARLIVLAGRARRNGRGEAPGLGLGSAWLLASAALVLTFTAQELLEAALTGGRGLGPAAVLGAGGWMAAPLAVLIGGVAALALLGARAVVAAAARRAPRRRPGRAPLRAGLRARPGHRPRLSYLASHLSGRAPPVAA